MRPPTGPWWTVAAGLALLAGAAWLRDPAIPYLAIWGAATALAIIASVRRQGWAPRLTTLALLVYGLLAGFGQLQLTRIQNAWPRTAAQTTRGSAEALQRTLGVLQTRLRGAAMSALDAPRAAAAGFAYVARLTNAPSDMGVVVIRGGQARAWAGEMRTAVDTSDTGLTVVASPFYLELQARARRGDEWAVASALLHADPPGDRLTRALDAVIASRTGITEFAVTVGTLPGAVPSRASDRVVLSPARGPAVTFSVVQPRSDAARLRITEMAESRAALALAVAIVAFVAADWRPRSRRWWRPALALAVPLGAIALIPLNAFSNASRLFDPTYFFSPVGGPYTASVGALGVTGAIGVLAALAAYRVRLRIRPAWLAGVVALVLCAGALAALRFVAAGITPPGATVPLTLWAGWQVALALGTTALLLLAAVAAQSAMPSARGLHPVIPVALAAVAAILGPALWSAPAGWPVWYAAVWGGAALAAAFTRRRGALIVVAIVAALSSAVVVWGTTVEKRVTLAERDLTGLTVPDPEALALLDRFGTDLAGQRALVDRADLLRIYAASDLAAAAYPVQLATWPAKGGPGAVLSLAPLATDTVALRAAVRIARRRHAEVMANVAGFPGVQLVLAVPAADGAVTTVVVAPQTHIIQDDPLAVLSGLAPEATLSPGYTISLLELVPRRFAGSTAAAADTSDSSQVAAGAGQVDSVTAPQDSASAESTAVGAVRWVRAGDDLHADWTVPGSTGPRRAHVEIPLRPFDALVQRAVLLVVVDLAAVTLLWGLNVTGDGRLRRWLRARARRWAGSYRTQLTAVLFAFFVVPAVLFAVWSYRRLRSDDAEQRALLVWETLRAAGTGGLDALAADAQRVGTPLLLYEQGALSAASDSLFQDLAPIGRLLRPDVELELDLGTEVRASRTQLVAGVPIVFGYRAVEPPGGQHVVLAAPARSDEIGLESRRTDLGILVLFTTVLGAAAALWLSGLAARQLARPIESLRRAAVAVAAGEREPDLAGNPPSEFVPVFSAFRRMAADFGESQRVLAWGEMARQIAHEIKNPLTPIRLGIQHLQRARAARRTDFDAILEQNATRILAEIDRLDHIARAFSRYGSAPADALPPEPTDLSAVVHDVVSLERLGQGGSVAQRRSMATDAVEWHVTGTDAPLLVLARSSELREVLLNVLENARLAHAARVRVTVSSGATLDTPVTGPGRESDGMAYVVVEDDGEGIPPEILPRVFEPHFSTRTSGSGLGLAVSRRIVDQWGGTIAVASAPGTGTRVSIGLLLVRK